MCRTTGMGFAAVGRVNDQRWIACAVRDLIDFGLQPGGEFDVATTICSEVRARGDRIVIDDVNAHPEFCDHPSPPRYGFRSFISLPIFRGDGSIFGTLCAIDPSPAHVENEQTVGITRATAEPNQQGLGLGLYIAAQIARAHGGTLDVTSDAERTRFTFRMPAIRA